MPKFHLASLKLGIIVELDAGSREELARGAFSDRLDITAVVFRVEVIDDAGDISVAVEIEGKSSVDEEQIK